MVQPEEWLGRRVVAHVHGGYASRAVAPVSGLAAVPEGLELRTAAALVHDGVTAAALLELTGVADGERVLVLGASGGMGTVLVQWARARGARDVRQRARLGHGRCLRAVRWNVGRDRCLAARPKGSCD